MPGSASLMGGRVPKRAKAMATDTLDDLRLKVLKAEIAAPAATAAIFATARYRIEMVRRALEIRIVDDEAAATPSRLATQDDPQPALTSAVRRNDRRIIQALRRHLNDRHAVVQSWEAIRQSHDLLARVPSVD